MVIRSASLLLVFASICLLIIAPPALAAPKGDQPGKHLTITEVLVDFENEAIAIFGEDLDFGPGPMVVTLGGELSYGDISSGCVASFDPSPQSIICDFSASGLPPDGDYLLTVSNGGGQSQGDEYDLTIGNSFLAGQSCPEGEFVTGFDLNGGLICASPHASPPACGDSNLDPGEVCDDGNTIDGDGCSANCRSNETCGNGIVDVITGEECDDGPGNGSSYCELDCTLVPQACTVGDSQLCTNANDFGVCEGSQVCDSVLGWGPCDAPVPEAERCDGLDNDCDGESDEDFLNLYQSCGEGACAGGHYECDSSGTGTFCTTSHLASTEICNGIDDNCDGTVDEGLLDTLENCGACGHACPQGPNAFPFCQSGQCGFFCDQGYLDCNNDPNDGCEYFYGDQDPVCN